MIGAKRAFSALCAVVLLPVLPSCSKLAESGPVAADEVVDANVTLPFYNSQEFTPRWLNPKSNKLAGFHSVPDFRFTNQDGKEITQAELRGKITVASFFFTTCPGVCSPVNFQLMRVRDAFAKDDAVRLLSHSITPDIDTVKVLKDYAAKRDIRSPQWHLVTGDRDTIYDVAKRGYFASDDLGAAEGTKDFKHTENVLLIDQHRRIRGIYNGLSTTAMFDLIADIKKLKQEEAGA